MAIGSGRTRWKFSFGRSSSPSSSSVGTPMSFICPISSSLMSDPVIIPTGHTFERSCIEACREFNFTPPSLSSSSIDLSSSFFLIPNSALRAAILDWCDRVGLPHPSPVSKDSARALVQKLISKSREEEEEEEYSNTKSQNKQQQPCRFSPPSSSSSSYPSTSSTSSFTSSEREINFAASSLDDSKNPKSTPDPAQTTPVPMMMNNPISSSAAAADPLEEAILIKLKNPQISVKESGLITLRHSARESGDRRISLCTPRILAALVPMILFKNSSIQINASAALVNLSIEPANKVKIVRSGAVPPLVEALKSNSSHSEEEARYNAAGALFSLALEDENKLVIGVLGAIPPLVNLFCQQKAGHVACVEAGMALYHLSLAPNNLSKIAKTAGAVKAILNMAATAAKGDNEEATGLQLRRVSLMLLASLARRTEGRVALMDADAVKAMVGMMEAGTAGKEEEYCLAVMYEMSKGKGSLRFRALARAAGVERVLQLADDQEARGEVGKEMARRILKVITGDYEGKEMMKMMMMLGDEEEDDVGSVVSDGLVSFRRRYDDFASTSTANSANF